MNIADIHARLQHTFRPWILSHDFEAMDPWIEIRGDGLAEICRYLAGERELRFNMLHCITGVDYFEPDEKKAAAVDWKPHVELIYHISSMVHRHRLTLKTRLPRWMDDEPGVPPEAPSVSGVWRTAEWHEREVYDLMGVYFLGNRDLRRILCPEDWEGFPLRKDYKMPVEYHGVPR